MWWSVWSFFLYIPLFIVAFILAIAAMSQRRIVLGLSLLLSCLVVPCIGFLILSSSRTAKFMKDHPAPGLEMPQVPRQPRTVAPPHNADARPTVRANIPSDDTATNVADASVNSPETQRLLEKTSKDSLMSAKAQEIVLVKLIKYDDTANIEKPEAAFSRDGRLLLYTRSVRKGTEFVIRDLITGQIVRSYGIYGSAHKMALSSDGKKLAFTSSEDNRLHIVDLQTQKDIPLPVEGESSGKMQWDEADRIDFVRSDTEWMRRISIDLDTLAKSETKLDSDMPAFAAYKASLKEHPNCKIATWTFQDNVERPNMQTYGTYLCVSNKNYTFTKILLPNLSRGDLSKVVYHVSPDLRHILLSQDGGLSVAYLGVGTSPRMNYIVKWEEDNPFSQFDPERVRGRQSSGAVYLGKVYAPLINPLNGRTTGPNEAVYKGVVSLGDWHNGQAVATKVFEFERFAEGDVITDMGLYRTTDGHIDGGVILRNGGRLDETVETSGWRRLTLGTPKVSASQEKPVQVRQTESVAVAAASDLPSSAKAEFPGERFPETRTRRLSENDVSGWGVEKLRYAINEMYARYGLDFKDRALSKHFRKFPWYKPDPTVSADAIEARLSDVESENVKFLGQMRNAKNH